MKKDNLYAEGSTVYAKHAPTRSLTIRRYVDRVYYCQPNDTADSKDLVYFERELLPAPPAESETGGGSQAPAN